MKAKRPDLEAIEESIESAESVKDFIDIATDDCPKLIAYIRHLETAKPTKQKRAKSGGKDKK